MLTYLEVWIENLVVIVLLTSLVEMLLPKSHLEKYTRVVLGLFILIAILNPLLNLFNTNYNLNQITELLTVSSKEEPKMSKIMERGKALQVTNQSKAEQNYKRRLARQISALLAFDKDLPSTVVNIKLKENHQIANILIKVKNEDNSQLDDFKGVKPIKINKVDIQKERTVKSNAQKNEKDSSLKIASKEIKERVANFYGLDSDQVIVQAE
ncbi:MAG: stage III sporulation protein AF [Candidatus Frackibacter sp. T328-2]|nr:MAG: stage III sporulation protein AF [Candidatus Frackibacter sp. T328-2]